MATATINQNRRKLPFPMQAQDGNYWCWAATAQAVLDFYVKKNRNATRDPLSQCAIATMVFKNKRICCPSVWHGPCDEDKSLRDALHVTGNHRKFENAACDFQTLIDEIFTKESVVCARMALRSNPTIGHFVVISGLSGITHGIQKVYVDDSMHGEQFVPLVEFLTNYLGDTDGRGGYFWEETYFTRP